MSEYNRNARIAAFLLILIALTPLTLVAQETEKKPNIVMVLMEIFV